MSATATRAQIKLARQKTLDSIVKHGPEHFDMNAWGRTAFDGALSLYQVPGIDVNNCGTTGCIAGHAVVANRIKFTQADRWNELNKVAAALDVTRDLFYSSSWPGYIQVYRTYDSDAQYNLETYEWAVSLLYYFVDHPGESEFPSHEAYNKWALS